MRFGDCELLEEIARGGMGVVYKARQKSLDRLVAVKLLLFGAHASAEFIKRFRIEASAAAALQHPNIVAIHEVGVHEGEHFLVMDYVDGPNLATYVKDHPLSPKRAAQYLKTIAEAIHYAHEKGILHRDLKPSNVLIGSNDQPRVTDFGLAKRFTDAQLSTSDASQLTLSGQVMGSPGYMPPEQASGARGKMSRRSDVYSLGATLYYLITGRAPFGGGSVAETLRQAETQEPVAPRLLNPDIPVDLETICLRCLEKEPEKRFTSARDLSDELDRYLRDEPIHSRPTDRVEKLRRWCRRNPRLAVALGALASVFVAGFVGVSWEWQQAKRESLTAKLNLYVGDMNLAQQSLAAGNLGRAMQLVERHRPKAGEPDFRGWEWRYLWRQCGGDPHWALPNQTGLVWAGDFSPDGRTLATGDDSCCMKIWDTATRQLLVTVNRKPSSVAFFPDGKMLVADGKGVNLLDTISWSEQQTPDWEQTLRGCRSPVAISKDCKLVAARSDTDVRIIDSDTKQEVRQLPNASGPLAFSPDASLLATDSEEGIKLWPLFGDASPRLLDDSRGLFAPINPWLKNAKCMMFSPDGAWLAAADNRRSFGVSVWEVASGRKSSGLAGVHAGEVSALSFSPDGHTLATGAWDHSIRLWDFPLRRLRATLQGHQHEVWIVQFSPDGRTLMSGGKDGAIKLWDLSSTAMDTSAEDGPVAFSSDGKTLAGVVTNSVLQFHDLQTGKTTEAFSLPAEAVTNLLWWRRQYAISPDLRTFAFCMGERKVQVWNITLAKLVAEWNEVTNRINDITFSPDGQTLALSFFRTHFDYDDRGYVKFWGFNSGQVRSFQDEQYGVISRLIYSPDGRLIATAHGKGGTILWDALTLRRRTMLQMPHGIQIAVFSPDCRHLATASVNNIGLWELSSGKLTGMCTGHKQLVMSVVFSPDGRTLASGGNDGTIRFWNVQTQQELLSFGRPGLHPVDLFFSPDGQILASGSRSFDLGIPQFPLFRAATWEETEKNSQITQSGRFP